MAMDSDPTWVKDICAKAAAGDEACKAASVCLQATRSVICSNFASASPTAYFAGQLAALQRHGEKTGGQVDPTMTTLLFIMRKAIPSTPPSVVSSRLNDLAAAVAGPVRSAEEAPVKLCLGCLAAAIDVTYNAGEGARPNRKILKPVFAMLGDARPSVQHQAQLTAGLVMKRAAGAGDAQTLEFATQHLSAMMAAGRPDKKNPDQQPVAQHVLEILKAVASSLPAATLTALGEAIVKLPGVLGQHPCCTAGFEFLAEYLSGDAEAGQAPTAKAEVAAALLPPLLAVQVTMLNVYYVKAYAGALASSAAVLCGESVIGQLPREVAGQKVAAAKKLLGLFAERDPTVLRGTREACMLLFEAAAKGGDLAYLEELPELCRPLLGYEAKGAWQHVLPVVTVIFSGFDDMRRSRIGVADLVAWTAARFARSRGMLEQLVQARDKARGGELNVFGEELAECLGAATSALGPDKVLEVAELRLLETPLNDRGFESMSRSWLLLVLKKSIRRTTASFFVSRFLPLATALKAKAGQAEAANQSIMGKKYATLLEQVWALLPGFFDEALDLQEALLAEGGKFAKQLVSVLLNESTLREYVWAAFLHACDGAREPPSKLSEALQASNRACLQTLSGRILPEMFNTYLKMHAESTGQDGTRLSQGRKLALDAVRSFVRLADAALVAGLFKKLVARLLKVVSGEDEADKPNALPLAELASALVQHLGADSLDLALKVFAPMLSGASATSEDKVVANALQKSAYKAVFGVIRHPACAAVGGQEGGARVLGLWNTLRDSRQTCSPAALKARISTIEAMLALTDQHLAPRFGEPGVRQEYLQCLTSVMPEILFHLRDQSGAVRDASRECLHIASTTAIKQDLQAEVVALISAGLAGLTRHSKASAVDALSRLLYEHSARFSEDLQDRLIGVVLLLLADTDAQVWRATLKFSKVVVFVVPKSRLPKHLPQLLRMFDSKHLASAKMLMRAIVERLVKVLPAEVLAETFPSQHQPLLHYVQRLVSRQRRPKSTRAVKQEEQGEGEGEGQDAEMGGDEDEAPKETWDAFQGEEAGETKAGGDDAAPAAGRKRRAAEPPTSAVMAHDAVQALLDAWEEESDDSDGEGGHKRKAAKGKRKREGEATSTWIHEDTDVPLDFMSADAAHSVLTTRAAPAKRRRAQEVGAAGAMSRTDALRRTGLRFAEDGRLVVAEDAPAKDEGEKKGGFTLGTDGSKGPGKVKALSKLAAMRQKRAEAKAKAKAAKKGTHTIKGLDAYKPGKKKADGDAVRKGQVLEPYAYVRLNPKVTKEKFKDKATASFAKVIKGAKKGVVRGLKAKARDSRLKKTAEAKDKRRKAGKLRAKGSR